MARTWKAWHEVVQLRPDLKSGELSLSQFAADLYDVMMGTARPLYQNPHEFFSLTYPTFALRELAKDVVGRLAGKNDKAVRQLELTYGGGKTHTLITLYHLTAYPHNLPQLPSVREFIQHIGMEPPQARVVVFPFDKLDVEKGMEVIAPDGSRRWLRQPWSVLAYQIAGDRGLRIFHAEGHAEERETAPAENLISELLAVPEEEGLATLILLDEVLMYAREKVGHMPDFLSSLVNFFQYLTQSAIKRDRCAIVASLLATDPSKGDQEGKRILGELTTIFRRQQEQNVEPVGKEDVAEVLRRRFFTPDSLQKGAAFREQVLAVMQNIYTLDDVYRRDPKGAEERFLQSYPFHPDLTEIFYTKWTNLEGFQRTRGILRTFALALRDAAEWDHAPLIGTNIFIGAPQQNNLSESARELSNVATREEYEGKRQEWSSILLGELQKARTIQKSYPNLDYRELERIVFATFLHSQPIGNRALTRDLLVLAGDTRPDRIDLQKALDEWVQTSWFLDESMTEARDPNDHLPKGWRLGSKPNLKQMHHEVMGRIPSEVIENDLNEAIQSHKNLKTGTTGIRTHFLPTHPRDVDDDSDFRFVVFGARYACMLDRIPDEVRRFFEWTTSEQKPRVYRNSMVAVAPSFDGIESARMRLREYKAWQEVKQSMANQEMDVTRQSILESHLNQAKQRIPEAVQQAYSIGLTINKDNRLIAFRINVSNEPLFNNIRAHSEARIQDKPIAADALLPGGPYAIWRMGDKQLRVHNIVNEFAQNPKHPKMLDRHSLYTTLKDGCKSGVMVLELMRPDKTSRTFWFNVPDDLPMEDKDLYLLPPEHANLKELPRELLKKDALPHLWENGQFTFGKLVTYFQGGTKVPIDRGGYSEDFFIPYARRETLLQAVENAVEKGDLWLVNYPSSIYREPIPQGILSESAILLPPPQRLSITDLVPDKLPNAWDNGETTVATLHANLNQQASMISPWYTIKQVIEAAINNNYLELKQGQFPLEYATSHGVILRMRKETQLPPSVSTHVVNARATFDQVHQVQDLNDLALELFQQASIYGIRLDIRVEVGNKQRPSDEVIAQLNDLLGQMGLRLE